VEHTDASFDRPTLAPTMAIDPRVVENPVQPGAFVGAFAQGHNPDKRPQHRLLHKIFGVVPVPGKPERRTRDSGGEGNDVPLELGHRLVATVTGQHRGKHGLLPASMLLCAGRNPDVPYFAAESPATPSPGG